VSSAWAAVVVSAIMLALLFAGLIWRDGRRDGRTDTILERLTGIAEDHEDRLRDLEHDPLSARARPTARRRTPPPRRRSGAG
jgi:hypothetical protein